MVVILLRPRRRRRPQAHNSSEPQAGGVVVVGPPWSSRFGLGGRRADRKTNTQHTGEISSAGRSISIGRPAEIGAAICGPATLASTHVAGRFFLSLPA
jgi:hypothetical protein